MQFENEELNFFRTPDNLVYMQKNISTLYPCVPRHKPIENKIILG